MQTNAMINPAGRLAVTYVGHEKTPVLCIDDFLSNCQVMREDARHQAAFSAEMRTMYPGVRAKLPGSYVKTALNSLATVLSRVYGLGSQLNVRVDDASYAIVSLAEDALNPYQCIPHFDNLITKSFAFLHYLNEGDFGGTGFFRHIPTNIERVTLDSNRHYQESVMNFFKRHGQPEKAYIKDTNAHYELIHKFDYSPNRLLVYPSNLLHSGLIRPDKDINPNPETGRLTASIFFHFT